MFDYDWNKHEKEIEKLDEESIRKNIVSGVYTNDKFIVANHILDKIRRNRENERVNASLKLAEDNVKTSRKLVIATWGLVLATILLGFFSFTGCK